jgi:preprotein translocase subunit YajC
MSEEVMEIAQWAIIGSIAVTLFIIVVLAAMSFRLDQRRFKQHKKDMERRIKIDLLKK